MPLTHRLGGACCYNATVLEQNGDGKGDRGHSWLLHRGSELVVANAISQRPLDSGTSVVSCAGQSLADLSLSRSHLPRHQCIRHRIAEAVDYSNRRWSRGRCGPAAGLRDWTGGAEGVGRAGSSFCEELLNLGLAFKIEQTGADD